MKIEDHKYSEAFGFNRVLVTAQVHQPRVSSGTNQESTPIDSPLIAELGKSQLQVGAPTVK